MNESQVRWVFMDAGDTFVYGYPTFYEAVQDCWKSIGTEMEYDAIVASSNEYFASRGQDELTSQPRFEAYFRGLYSHVLNDLSFPGDIPAYVDRLWGEWCSGHRLRLFDDSRSALQLLRDHGYRLGIVSNWDQSFQPVLQRLGVWDLFDIHVNSVSVGMAKPDAEIFRSALAQADASATQCWFLGDQISNDIEPAKLLGMKTVLVDYYDKCKPDQKTIPDALAASMTMAVVRLLQIDGREIRPGAET